MPVHKHDGHLYIADTEAIWREHMRLYRQERIARWCVVVAIVLVLGVILGLLL